MQTIIEKLEVLLEAAKTGKMIEQLAADGITERTAESMITLWDIRLKPTPKLRPWKLEEVPLEGWFRHSNSNSSLKVTGITPGSIWFNEEHGFTPEELLNWVWTLTPFDSASWKPCGVEE